MVECKTEENKIDCNCSYPCDRKGMCCECLSYHRNRGEVPACFFPKDVEKTFAALKLQDWLKRSKKRGTKSPLIVVNQGSVLNAARNLPGVDVISVDKLQVRHLAPGTHPGRLTLFSEAAIAKISELGDVV